MAINKSSVGNATLPVLFLLVTLGILIAGGYVVSKTLQKNGTTLSNPLSKVAMLAGGALPRATEADFTFVEDPLVRKNFVAQANTSAFRITSSSDGRGAGEETISDVVMKNVDDVRFRTRMVSGGKDTSDMVMIGDTTYLKDQKDGSWWVQKAKTAPAGSEESLPEPEDFKEEYTQKTKMMYKKIGEEPCPSPVTDRTCYKYLETESNTVDSPTRTFWFDNKDFLLRKDVNGYGEFTSMNLYSYDGVTVSTPNPTKPVPEGKSVFEIMTSGAGGLPPPQDDYSPTDESTDMPDDEGY